MRSIVYTRYGSADVIRMREVPQPEPKDNEVAIRIGATVATPPDCAFRTGKPFATRLFTGLFRPQFIPGTELAGIVEAVGKDVTRFRTGDRVFAAAGTRFGAYAEYRCLPEDANMALQPAGLTDAEAVALLDGGLTSLVFLRDVAQLRSGQRILVNGASGAVGAYAVQLARYYGADVTAVCSGKNAAFVQSLGADRVTDYTAADFTQTAERYDVVFDAIGKSTFRRCRHLLRPQGKYLGTVPSPALLLRTLLTKRSNGKRGIFAATGLQQRPENLRFLAELAEAGHLRPVIDRTYAFEAMAEAHRYVETGRKRGNVVVTLQPEKA